jgi:hypothetical protein
MGAVGCPAGTLAAGADAAGTAMEAGLSGSACAAAKTTTAANIAATAARGKRATMMRLSADISASFVFSQRPDVMQL